MRQITLIKVQGGGFSDIVRHGFSADFDTQKLDQTTTKQSVKSAAKEASSDSEKMIERAAKCSLKRHRCCRNQGYRCAQESTEWDAQLTTKSSEK